MKTLSLTGAIITALFILSSCGGEDPALVKKHGEQQAEIARLNGELALLQERLKNLPPDQSNELTKAVGDSEKLEEERSRLEGEVVVLEAEHKELVDKFEEYKRKYAIR